MGLWDLALTDWRQAMKLDVPPLAVHWWEYAVLMAFADDRQVGHGVLYFERNPRRLDAGQDRPWYQAIDVRRLLAEAERTPRESPTK